MKLKYILAALMLVFAMPARAELRIDVSGAERKALPIAIPEMIGANSNKNCRFQLWRQST